VKMGKVITLLLLSILISTISFSQGVSVQVNLDGTHSVINNSNIVHHTENVAVKVNSDGSHSVIYNSTGNVAIQVNPDGAHSVIHNSNGNVAIQVNPNGDHTIIHNTSKTKNTNKVIRWDLFIKKISKHK
jgi:hypothetical protein